MIYIILIVNGEPFRNIRRVQCPAPDEERPPRMTGVEAALRVID
jgi:hypothetical protein